MDETSQSNQYITAIPIVSGLTTIALGLVLLFFKGKSNKDSIDAPAVSVPEEEVEELDKSVSRVICIIKFLDSSFHSTFTWGIIQKYPGGYLSIFYGSQTGTAESFARDLEREGEDKGFKVNVVDLEDVEEDVVGNILSSDKRDEEGRNRALFLMATYGEGEPTDNAASFVNFLKMKAGLKNNDSIGEEKKEEADSDQTDPLCFKGLHYAVFGLGNTQYEHYNAMGKTVDEGLGNTGAQRLLSIGLGDDDKDLDGDFESWKDEKLWPTIEKLFIPKDAGVSQAKKEELPKCHYRVEFVTSAAEEKSLAEEDVPLSSKAYFNSISCPINVKKELRNESDDGSTMHIEFDLSNASDALSYQTADNLGILPVNHDDVVKGVAEALGYDLTAVFKLKPSKGYEAKFSQLFPNPCTIQEFLASFCDLSGSPRRSDLKLLAPYAKGTLCKKALLRMASKEGKQEYREKIVDCKLGYADIISKLCPTIEMPLEHFISVCPRLSPRYYTISSSSTVHPNNIHVTVSVLEEKRKDGSSFKGVCSNFLASMIADGTARIFVKDSSFRLPSDVSIEDLGINSKL